VGLFCLIVRGSYHWFLQDSIAGGAEMVTKYRKARGVPKILGVIAALALVATATVLLPAAAPARAGNCSAGWVALTYDDGPNPTRTNAVLAALDSVDAKATFFVLGTLSKSNPGTLRKTEAAGHAIGNHSYSHQYFIFQSSGAIASSIKAADGAIRAAGVDALRLVRPPGGNTNPRVKAAIEGAGFTQILWTWGPLDYNSISAWTIASGVISHAKDGAVFVLHDNSGNYRNTAAATKTIVSTLRSRGYCFGVLDRYGRIVPSEPVLPACLEEGQAAPDVDLQIVGGPAAVAESLEEYLGECVSGDVLRSWGADRYETAAELAGDYFGGGADTVFVVVGTNFPDAMAASPAAARVDAPVLLTKTNGLPAATASALAALSPSQIFVVGGTAVISDAVVNRLSGFAPVTRLAGADRYATAAAVSASEFAGGADTVFVATGLSYFDSLVSGSAAVHTGAPLLLTRSDVLPNVTASELSRLLPDTVVIVGGTIAVTGEVEDAIAALVPGVSIERLAGSNRYTTSVAAAEAADLGGEHKIFIATDVAFPDGLAAVAAANGLPLLLVSYDTISAPVATAITTLYD
jgi:putative cell wall-binding protein/peptidoglycan/xylan/chitin deacetylase (PgdA/CDA1 family)